MLEGREAFIPFRIWGLVEVKGLGRHFSFIFPAPAQQMGVKAQVESSWHGVKEDAGVRGHFITCVLGGWPWDSRIR